MNWRETMLAIIVWAKRASGIGYYEFPPLSEHVEKARELRDRSAEIAVELDKLARELESRGFKIKR